MEPNQAISGRTGAAPCPGDRPPAAQAVADAMGAWDASGRARGNLALIAGGRALTGTGLDGVAVTLAGATAPFARCQPGGAWLTAAGGWLPRPGPDTERGAG